MAPIGIGEDGGEMEMRFRNIFSRDSAWPQGRFIVIEHQTPDALWRPEFTMHANGAQALVEAAFTAPEPEPTVRRLERLLDRLDGVLVTGATSNVHPPNFGVHPSPDHEPYDLLRDSLTLPLMESLMPRNADAAADQAAVGRMAFTNYIM